MPTLEQLHRGSDDREVAVLAVSVDRSRGPLAPFVAEHDLTLPVFWDRLGEVSDAYRATSIPVSYLIDPTGMIVGMARGARDWAAAAPLFDALREAVPAASAGESRYARLDGLELPEVLEPPTAEWSLPEEALRPGRPFVIEVRLRWSGRIEDYLPQPPQIPLPEGISRGRVAASSSSLDRSHLVRYEIELTAAEPGTYALDPIELRYLPALGDGPVAARVAGPTVEAAAAAVLGIAGLWLYHRRRHGAAADQPEPPRHQRLRHQLDRAKARRLAGEAGAGYEILVAVARELETDDERSDLEQRLETVRFGGSLPDGAELEAIERRLERALAALEPDPDQESRRRLRLRPGHHDPPRPTSKETHG